jgi:hypothetical protein
MLKSWAVNLSVLLVVVTFLALVVLFALPYSPLMKMSPRIASTPSLLTQVQGLSQLVSVKYVLEKVVLIEDESHWYELQLGENRLLMVAHGVVKAGVDLSELKPGDLEVSGKKITIKLPPARITDTYLDDNLSEIIDRKTGLLRTFDKDMEQNARRQAVEDINRAARNAGIIKDAQERAALQIKSLFLQLGYENVEVKNP